MEINSDFQPRDTTRPVGPHKEGAREVAPRAQATLSPTSCQGFAFPTPTQMSEIGQLIDVREC